MRQDCRSFQDDCEGLDPAKLNHPAISVVIPARNESVLVGRCLTALQLQNFSHAYEVIVVDNASTDSTSSIANQFPFRVIKEDKVGQLQAKHCGVLAAEGEIVVVLDADCVPPSTWLSSIYEAFSTDTAEKIAAVTGRYRYEPGMPLWGKFYAALMQFILIDIRRMARKPILFVIGGNVAFRRKHYHVSGGYPLRGGLSQTELGLARSLRTCGEVKYLPSMELVSSPRRFRKGPVHFFFGYKLRQYFTTRENFL